MNYKDLNVYQRAYKVAIDLHIYLEKNASKFTQEELNRVKNLSREVLGCIAEGFSQRTPKAKRFFNFRALDALHALQLDIDFLHDIRRLPDDQFQHFNEEYDICSKQLYKFNRSILDNANAPKEQPAAAEAVAA